MVKVKMNIEGFERLKRSYPNAIINKLNDSDYMVDGIDSKIVSQFGQLVQDVKIKAVPAAIYNKIDVPAEVKPLSPPQSQQSSLPDFNASFQMFFNLMLAPKIEEAINTALDKAETLIRERVVKQARETEEMVHNLIEANIMTKFNDIEKKLDTNALEAARRDDEAKKLNEDEHQKIQANIASLADYFRKVPLPK